MEPGQHALLVVGLVLGGTLGLCVGLLVLWAFGLI